MLVSLITVNLDGRDYLDAFFASVFAQDFPADQLEVLMVDNGSTDGSVAFVQERYPAVRVLSLPENQGFAAPNNLAAEAATGRYLALLNNDMRLAPDWLATMVAHREAGTAACVASRILNWDGSQVDFIEGTLAFHGMGAQTAFGEPAADERTYPTELLFACGGAMLIDRAVFLEAGGFDADYFAYFEDVDLGWRLWVMGERVTLCPAAVAYHHHNGTSARFGWAKKLVLFERNALYTLIKNYDDATLEKALPAALLLAFKRLAVRAGVDRAAYRFSLPEPPPPRESLARRSWLLLQRQGPKAALKKLLVKLARRTLDRLDPPPPGDPIAVERNGYASVVAMEDLLDHLPRLMEKRRWVQARRRRADAEILALFRTPFDPVELHPAYVPAHAAVLEHWGVMAHFERVLERVLT